MMKRLLLYSSALVLLGAVSIGARANSVYPLNGSYADNDGSGPALNPDSGTLNSTGYQFGANQGLYVSNVLADTRNYSIELLFRLDDTSGYRKLIDFANRSADTGLYVHNGGLEFYNIPSAPAPVVINPSQIVTVLLTRDAATKAVSGYVNGVQQFGFVDNSSIAVFSGTNGIVRFFEDDLVQGTEASGGFVDRIRIADNALGQFGPAANATPLPTAGVAGLALLSGLGMRRNRRTAAHAGR